MSIDRRSMIAGAALAGLAAGASAQTAPPATGGALPVAYTRTAGAMSANSADNVRTKLSVDVARSAIGIPAVVKRAQFVAMIVSAG